MCIPVEMKDITYYFKNGAKNVCNITSPATESKDETKSVVNPSTNSPHTEEISSSEKHVRLRKRKKPAKYPSPNNSKPTPDLNKSSDDFETVYEPLIKNRRSTKRKRTTIHNPDTPQPEHTPTTPTPQNDENLPESPSKSTNVFRFMMESRQKVIGSNSPGKKLDALISTDTSTELKEKLTARRFDLERWAERKGGLDRKEAEKQAEICAKRKLRKRAERLKGLLGVDDESGRGKERKRIVVVDSESSCSSSFFEVVENIVGDDVLVCGEEERRITRTEGSNHTERSTRSKKRKQERKHQKSSESELTYNMENSSSLSPWKMRIKLLNDSDEGNNAEVCLISSEEDEDSKKLKKDGVKLAPIFCKKPKLDSSTTEAKKHFLQSGIPENLKRFVSKQTT